MLAALIFLNAALPPLLAIDPKPPTFVVSAEPLPRGAVASFGVPHNPFANPYYPYTAAYTPEGSFRVAVGDGKDVRMWAWHAEGTPCRNTSSPGTRTR